MATNGYSYHVSSASLDGRGGPTGGAPELMAHIKDIQASAMAQVDDLRAAPITRLLEHAQNSFTSAKMLLQSRRGQTKAYRDYLVAYALLVDTIPRHYDYYERIESNRGQTHRAYRDLRKEVDAYNDQFIKIMNIIKNDNKRTGVQPGYVSTSSRPSSRSSEYSTSQGSSAYSQESRYSMPNGVARQQDDELMLPPANRSSLDVPSSQANGRISPTDPSASPRRRPPAAPKPQALHGRAIPHGAGATNGSGGSDDIAARFAKLRGPSVETKPQSSAGDLSVKMPSPADYQSSSRPLGPRDMPAVPSHPAPGLPKLPLNTQFAASLPKEPAPAYSPARNLSTPASINPPRSTARSMVGTGGRSSSIVASSASVHPPHTNGETDSYFPSTSQGKPTSATVRRKSVHVPREFEISAEKLYDYTKMYNVLLIDVRNRDDFDMGHIWVSNIMCIEPTALQDGYSAEQLQDRLVLSPEDEQIMFDRRDRYDLVVYYDDSTPNTSFLKHHARNESEVALRRLFDTLYEFNAEKPLQRAPILLMGGLEAWTGLLGSMSLKTSNTAAIVASGHSKPSRAIRRVPAASSTGRLNLQKRRVREYAPMDPEEERKWLEEARKDRPKLDQLADEDGADEQESSAIFRTTEDFLRRYPAVDAEQQSMMYPPPRPPVPNTYVAPAIPVAPSRPPPAVPRMSYSGVHERQIAPQGRTTQTPAYVSPSHLPQYRLPRTGLFNFGNTCYMNSTIQCLNATMPLTHLFVLNSYLKNLQRDNWKGTKGLISEGYATLLQNLWKNDVTSLRPISLRRICARFNSEWGSERQQDAKEFLEFLLDLLHEDQNQYWAKPPLQELTEQEEQARERLPRPYAAKIEWFRYVHREKSPILDMFAGQHASRLRCNTCGTTSTTYEAFWSISVEIPHDRPGDIRECLASYCAPERLSGDDIWRCPRCKVDREATKQISITRAPQFLVVHLKRFSASLNERTRKIRYPIEFPLHGLDLGPYMLPPMTQSDEDYVLHNAKNGVENLADLKSDPSMNGPYIYNAYGVMRHIGASVGSGHYIACVKDKARGCWRQFNDDRVGDFDPTQLAPANRLQNEQAYILFFERDQGGSGRL